jgi:hypothetical protein
MLVPYKDSIHFEVGHDVGKNVADVMMDFSGLLYLLASYLGSAFLLMESLYFAVTYNI